VRAQHAYMHAHQLLCAPSELGCGIRPAVTADTQQSRHHTMQERPDAILPTMGGQTGLNLAKALSEVRA